METLFPTLVPARENAITTEERNALVLSCERLCKSIARRLTAGVAGADTEDMEQEALVACVEAAKRWHPNMGTKFSTYATPCIERHLTNLVTSIRCEASAQIEKCEGVADGRGSGEADAPDRPPLTLTEEQEEALFRLPTEQHEAVCMVLHGASPDQIADRMGKSVKDVKLILRNAARDLRRSLAWLSRPQLFGGDDAA